MERIFKIFNKEYVNINQAAIILGLFAFLSQILALLRDRSIAHFIGPSQELDAYYAAFKVPDFIFLAVTSLSSVIIIMPFLLSKMVDKNSKTDVEITNNDLYDKKITGKARDFLNNIFTSILFFLIFSCILAYFFMPNLVSIIVPGFSPEAQDSVVKLSRIMLISPIILGISSFFGILTQFFHKFFILALSPIFYNIGIIFGVIYLYPIYGISGLAFGVILGALGHLLIQMISINYGFKPSFSKVNFKEIIDVVKSSFARTLALMFHAIGIVFLINLASSLYTGSISIFQLSFNLQSVPLNIIGISYSLATFPLLVKSFSNGAIKDFRNNLKLAARQIVFWSLPIMSLFIVLRAQITRVILGSGSFSWSDTRLVAASIAIFSISIIAQNLSGLFIRAYYASDNRTRPLIISFISFISIIVFSYLFLFLFNNFEWFKNSLEYILKVSNIKGSQILMLALGYSVAAILNFFLLYFYIKRDFLQKEESEKFISRTFFQSLIASFAIGFTSYISLNIFSLTFATNTFFGILFQGLISGLLGICIGVFVLYMLHNEEINALMNSLRAKFQRAKIITSSEEFL